MIDRGRLGADYGVVRLRNGGAASSGTPSFGSLREAAEAGYHGKAVNIEGKGVQKVSFADSAYDKTMAAKSAAASGGSGGGSGSSSSSGARNVVSSAASTGKGFLQSLAEIPGNIARDVSMGFTAGFGFSGGRDQQRANLAEKGYSAAEIDDYFRRTDETIARNAAEAAARGDRDDGGIASLAPAKMSAEELARAFAEGRDLTGQTQQSLQPLILEYLRGKGITNFSEYLPKIFETLQLPATAPVLPVIGEVPVQQPVVEQPVQQPITQYPAFTPIQPVGSGGAFMPAPFPNFGLPSLGSSMQPVFGGPVQPMPPMGQPPQNPNDPFGLRQGFV